MAAELQNPNQNQVSELSVLDFDAATFYVANAKQAAFFYNKLFGFDIIGYRGPETGAKDTASYVLKQNQITFVLTSALTSDHPIAAHVANHGDGIRDLGMKVSDVESVYKTALARGAKGVMEPTVLRDTQGVVKKATIAAYGDTTHTFVERSDYKGLFEPGYEAWSRSAQSTGLVRIDHAVANLEKDRMDVWADYYQRIFGFYVLRHYSEKDISTEYSALVSKVMANKSGTIKLPLNEPADGLKKSQIQEYLDYYRTPGIQHLAISTNDIIETVQTLRLNGVDLMNVPDSYYENVSDRIGDIAEPLTELAKLGIIVDRDDDGYLLQIFTQPLQDRPTLFFEIIQRHGATGFGKGNFKALFEAIERDQDRRGNL
jgi:4-hydroxyphenylpyruvate dioxygenase